MPLPVQPCTERRNTTREISQQCFRIMVRGIHPFDDMPLNRKKCVDVGKAKACQPIPMLHNHLCDGCIFQEAEQFLAAIVDAGGHLLVHCISLLAEPSRNGKPHQASSAHLWPGGATSPGNGVSTFPQLSLSLMWHAPSGR